MNQNIPVFEVHRSYELDEKLWSGDGEPFRFRIEILRDLSAKDPSSYARLYRREYFRIQPTFPQEAGLPKLSMYDKIIIVADDFLVDFDASRSHSSDECLAKVLQRIREEFGVNPIAQANDFR